MQRSRSAVCSAPDGKHLQCHHFKQNAKSLMQCHFKGDGTIDNWELERIKDGLQLLQGGVSSHCRDLRLRGAPCCVQVIRSGLGPLPLAKGKDDKDGAAEDAAEEAPTRAPAPASNRPAVLPDGSYATQVCPACPSCPARADAPCSALLIRQRNCCTASWVPYQSFHPCPDSKVC